MKIQVARLSACPLFQLLNQQTNLQAIYYEGYSIEKYSNLYIRLHILNNNMANTRISGEGTQRSLTRVLICIATVTALQNVYIY
jgi:hypothetical protein